MIFSSIYTFFNKEHLLSRLFQINIALWFLRMVLPGIKYVFIPSFFIFVISFFIINRKIIFNRSLYFEFLKIFSPLVILGVLVIYAIFLSKDIYIIVLKDLFEYSVNIMFLITFFILSYTLKDKDGIKYLLDRIIRIIWISAFFVAVLGLIKYGIQLNDISIPIQMPYGTSLNSDRNFFALYSMLGIIGLVPRLTKTDKSKLFINIFILSVLIANILFAYSFRSVFLLVLILMILLVIQIFSQNKRIINLSKNLRLFTSIYLLIFISLIYGWKTENNKIVESVKNYTHNITTELDVDIAIKEAFNTNKWNYALELYKNKSIVEKLFGSGFDYLSKFGLRFNNDKNILDYPHNPMLSGLLYSGIVGGVLILFFMLVSLYYGGKYFIKYPLFSLMLFTSTLFVFFSGNSLFSVPIFLFLFSISFIIRYQEISELMIIENINKPGAKFIKELFDYILASLTLVFLLPLLLLISIIIMITTGWPVVFTQIRIGQNAKPFRLYKFRTMKKVKASRVTIAAVEQNRVTFFGKFLRKYKLDELPELWNIIRGDMSFVGPRPDVVGYADKLQGDDRGILQLKPGLTGAASLKYMHEEDILLKQDNPQKYNDEYIFPDKVKVNKKYMKKWSLWIDLKIIILTITGKSQHEDNFL